MPPLRRHGRHLGWVLALGTYGGIALFLTHGAWQAPHTDLVGANDDGPQNAWFLAWVAFAVTHATNPLLITVLSPAGHPIGLMWQDGAPLLGLLLAPVNLAAGPGVAYNLSITAGLALSACSAYLALGTVTRHRGPAWVGGLIFGFSPWMLGEAIGGHPFLVNMWLVPPFFLLLVSVLRINQGRRVLAGVALGGVAALQLLISQEVLADCLLLGALITIGFGLADRTGLRQRALRVGVRLLAAGCTFMVIAGVPLAFALLGPGHGLHGALESLAGSRDDLLSLVVPKDRQLLAPSSLAHLDGHLAPLSGPPLYLGLPLMLVVAWAWWRHRSDPWVRGAVPVCGAVVVLALGPVLAVGGLRTGLPLPWAALVHLPVFDVMVPDRIGAVAYLAAGLCLARILDRWWPSRTDARLAQPVALALLCVLPLAPAGPLPRWIVPTPSIFTTRAARLIPLGTLVALAGPGVHYDAAAMLWQADTGFDFRLPWGYAIGAGPHRRRVNVGSDGTLGALWSRASTGESKSVLPAVRARARADLCRWGARMVIVGPLGGRSQVVAATTAVLGRPPQWGRGVARWYVPITGCRRWAASGQPTRTGASASVPTGRTLAAGEALALHLAGMRADG